MKAGTAKIMKVVKAENNQVELNLKYPHLFVFKSDQSRKNAYAKQGVNPQKHPLLHILHCTILPFDYLIRFTMASYHHFNDVCSGGKLPYIGVYPQLSRGHTRFNHILHHFS